MRAERHGTGSPRIVALAAAGLFAAWIPASAVIDADVLNLSQVIVAVLSSALFALSVAIVLRKRRRVDQPSPMTKAALTALGISCAILVAELLWSGGGVILQMLYLLAVLAVPALLALSILGGKGKSGAVTANRTLRLTAKSLEDENRQLTDMAARLEYERNGLQQRRVELEKENKTAEERIKQLCETADAFFTLGQSIDYARRIQQALTPSEIQLRQIAGDSFLLNLPRDKVSGDFLWCNRFDDGWIMICVADCTGHGVPGAFMSALGTMLLGHIVTERGVRRPDQVLFAMDRNLRSALSSNGGDIQDGMEMAVLLISPGRNQAMFAGARHKLFRTMKGECAVIDGVHRAIGGRLRTNAPAFESITLSLRKEEVIYLSSDGFQDQLGGPNDRRYLSGRFADTLAWIGGLPIGEQREALLRAHTQWRAGRDQTDDILVVGMQI
jgi:serine phosphatase RsbU (regulator of sigma subunit)